MNLGEGLYIRMYVTATPDDDIANKGLIKLISNSFKLSKSDIEIISGLKAHKKLIKITNANEDILSLLNYLE